jgi:hypothetical protein
MKITKSRLKQIIKEEIEVATETLNAGSIEEDESRDGPFLKSASRQGPGWSSEPTNPRELTPREKLADLEHQLKTAYYNPGAAPAIQQQIDDLKGEHPELAEGQTLAEISGDTPWKQVNQQIMSAKNALQKGDPKKALAILTDLLELYPKFDIK